MACSKEPFASLNGNLTAQFVSILNSCLCHAVATAHVLLFLIIPSHMLCCSAISVPTLTYVL